MRSVVTALKMLAAVALAFLGGLVLAGGLAGHTTEVAVGAGIFLLAASQLLLLAWFWR